MKEWWHWSRQQDADELGFAVIGIGRFGSAVCRELLSNGADVLAVDNSEKAIEELNKEARNRIINTFSNINNTFSYLHHSFLDF